MHFTLKFLVNKYRIKLKLEKGGPGMKISTKGRYALRLLLVLANAEPDQYVSIKQISEQEDISRKYLEQIMIKLIHANFVKSFRGAQGGYCLTRRPEEYTVGEILRLTEGSLSPVACAEMDRPDILCSRALQCPTLKVWRKISQAINETVDQITLADLLNQPNSDLLQDEGVIHEQQERFDCYERRCR